MRPPRHMLPKAPWPARWVPPPGTRGIRDTARPAPGLGGGLVTGLAEDGVRLAVVFLFFRVLEVTIGRAGRTGGGSATGSGRGARRRRGDERVGRRGARRTPAREARAACGEGGMAHRDVPAGRHRKKSPRAVRTAMEVCTSLTRSGLMGLRNTSGSWQEPPPWTATVGRAAGAILIVDTRGRDARGAERGRAAAVSHLLSSPACLGSSDRIA